jgi:hypothetical protein
VLLAGRPDHHVAFAHNRHRLHVAGGFEQGSDTAARAASIPGSRATFSVRCARPFAAEGAGHGIEGGQVRGGGPRVS